MSEFDLTGYAASISEDAQNYMLVKFAEFLYENKAFELMEKFIDSNIVQREQIRPHVNSLIKLNLSKYDDGFVEKYKEFYNKYSDIEF